MYSVNLITSGAWAVRSSWSYNFTLSSSGEAPAVIVVVQFVTYQSEITQNDAYCTLDGNSITQLAHVTSNYSTMRFWVAKNVQSGSHTVAVNNLRGYYESGYAVVGIYQAIDYYSNNLIQMQNPSDSYTAQPTLNLGHVWLEFAHADSTTYPAPNSSQTILTTINRGFRCAYKLDNGSGAKSFSWTFPAGDNDTYFGMEIKVVLGGQFRILGYPGLS